MARPTRNHRVPNLGGAILEAAWSNIAEAGAPALSLRAIARQLGITAPAIYNYYPSRDELVTALVIDAFNSLAESQVSAAAAAGQEPLARLHAIGLAYRQWAVSHPQRYQLLFGPPLAGYEMPRARVLPSSARSISVLVGIVQALREQARLTARRLPVSPIGYEAYYRQLSQAGIDADQTTLTVAVLIWSRMHGIVSLELSGNMLGADGESLLLYELSAVEEQFFAQGDEE